MVPSSLYGFLGAGLLGAALAGGGAWVVQGWRLGAEIETLKTAQADATALSIKAALDDLTLATGTIRAAAEGNQLTVDSLNAKLDAIRKDVKNVKPLPVDCVPDAVRVRALEAAVGAANETAARPKPRSTVPADYPPGGGRF